MISKLIPNFLTHEPHDCNVLLHHRKFSQMSFYYDPNSNYKILNYFRFKLQLLGDAINQKQLSQDNFEKKNNGDIEVYCAYLKFKRDNLTFTI